MTLLALLRHADTAWSREGRIQGRADVPLLAGASCRLPDACRGMRVVTSPLRRCVETVALLGAGDALREPRLVEMDWGSWQGKSLAHLRKALGEAMLQNEARGLDFTPPGGESPRLVVQRLKTWLCEIGTAGVPTLAVTHRGVIARFLPKRAAGTCAGKRPQSSTGRRSISSMSLPTARQAWNA